MSKHSTIAEQLLDYIEATETGSPGSGDAEREASIPSLPPGNIDMDDSLAVINLCIQLMKYNPEDLERLLKEMNK